MEYDPNLQYAIREFVEQDLKWEKWMYIHLFNWASDYAFYND